MRLMGFTLITILSLGSMGPSAHAYTREQIELVQKDLRNARAEVKRIKVEIKTREDWLKEQESSVDLWPSAIREELAKRGLDVESGSCDCSKQCDPKELGALGREFKGNRSFFEKYPRNSCHILWEALARPSKGMMDQMKGGCGRTMQTCPLVSRERARGEIRQSLESLRKDLELTERRVENDEGAERDFRAEGVCEDCHSKSNWEMGPNGPYMTRGLTTGEKFAAAFNIIVPTVQSIAGVAQFAMGLNSFQQNYGRYLDDCKYAGMVQCSPPPYFGGGYFGNNYGAFGFPGGGIFGGNGFGGSIGFGGFGGGPFGFGGQPGFGGGPFGGPAGFSPWSSVMPGMPGAGFGGGFGAGFGGGFPGYGGFNFGFPGAGGLGGFPGAFPGLGNGLGGGFGVYGGLGGFNGGLGGLGSPYGAPYGSYFGGPFVPGFPGVGGGGFGGSPLTGGFGGPSGFGGLGGLGGGAGYYDPSMMMGGNMQYQAMLAAQAQQAQQAMLRAQQQQQSYMNAYQQFMDAQSRLIQTQQNVNQSWYSSGLR